MIIVRRISFWILSTVSVVVLLFSYHTSTSGSLATASPAAIEANPTTSSTGTGGAAGSAGSSEGGSSGSSGSSGSTGSGSASGTVTGTAANTRWGPVQVQLTVAAGKVTAVSVIQYPATNPRDVEINNYALPILIRSTLQSQSTNIDMVSGATVTSVGYLQSLQSALDQAGL